MCVCMYESTFPALPMQNEWWPELLTLSKHKSLNVILYTQWNNLPIDQQWKTQKDWLNQMRNSYNRKNGNFYFFMFRFRLRCHLQNINVLQQNWKLKILTIFVSVQGSSLNSFFTLKVVIKEPTNHDLRSRRPEDTHQISQQRLSTASRWDPRDVGQNCRLHQLV